MGDRRRAPRDYELLRIDPWRVQVPRGSVPSSRIWAVDPRPFLNAFAIPPAGTLTWAGSRDTFWLACLLTASLLGTGLARILHARAAYRRITAGTAQPTAGSGDWRDT